MFLNESESIYKHEYESKAMFVFTVSYLNY